MSETVIKFEGVSKKYCRSIKHTMMYGVSDLSRGFLGFDQQTERLRDGEFWALNEVGFEVKRGEIYGIVGANGSGKSTLLKMLNGIMMPDKGRIEITGRIGALIEVGAGFHPMLTGRENVYINGAIIGMTKKEIDKKFDEIVDFAGIDSFIDSPVKHYSSGMYVRLGFAIAAHAELDILLVDEVLAVGDVAFQIKCMDRIMDMRSKGVTVMFVTHDANALKRFCDKAIWLHGGDLMSLGDPIETADAYLDFMRKPKEVLRKPTSNIYANISKSPEHLALLDSIEMLDSNNEVKDSFECLESAKVRIKYSIYHEVVGNLVLGIAIIRNDNLYVCGLNTVLDEFQTKKEIGEHTVNLEYSSLNLLPGSYYLDVGLFYINAQTTLSYRNHAYNFHICSPYKAEGVVLLQHEWKNEA